MSAFVNLTPHAVNIFQGRKVVVSYPSEGFVRVGQVVAPCGALVDDALNEVGLFTVRQGEVEGLPEPKPGTIYIVSRLTAQAVGGRDDVVFPLGEVRDENGRILGVTGFGCFPISDA